MRNGSWRNGKEFSRVFLIQFKVIFRAAEHDQTAVGVERVIKWSLVSGYLGPDDILISASADEIMSREVLHQLRWCDLANDVSFGALWMPMGNFARALRVDQPSHLGKHLFMQPTIYKWSAIMSGDYEGQRLICREQRDTNCSNALVGGIHLTHGASLPTSILKEFTATEEGYYSGAINWNFVFTADLDLWNVEQDRLYNMVYRPMFLDKTGLKHVLSFKH